MLNNKTLFTTDNLPQKALDSILDNLGKSLRFDAGVYKLQNYLMAVTTRAYRNLQPAIDRSTPNIQYSTECQEENIKHKPAKLIKTQKLKDLMKDLFDKDKILLNDSNLHIKSLQ